MVVCNKLFSETQEWGNFLIFTVFQEHRALEFQSVGEEISGSERQSHLPQVTCLKYYFLNKYVCPPTCSPLIPPQGACSRWFYSIILLFANDRRFLLAKSTGSDTSKLTPSLVFAVVRQTPTQRLENQFPALHWEHELGLAFTKNRMNYTNKFLVIPEQGDYFVYSQVTFRGTTSECGGISQRSQLNKPDSIIVVITKVTDSYPEPTQLLMGTKSVCEIGSNWFQPIYLGAMFSLQEGDKLMVNVSDIALVDYTKEDKTFFGAFLL